MDDHRSTEKFGCFQTLQQEAAIRGCHGDIAQVARMTRTLAAGWTTVVCGWTHMKMIARQLTAFATEVARPMNMESVFTWWELGEFSRDRAACRCIPKRDFTLYAALFQ